MWFYNLLADAADSGNTGGGGSNTGTIIMLVVLVVAIVGLFVWQSISNKKRQKEAQAKVDALKIGDRVKTIGGICGFVHEINNAENTFVLETGTGDNKAYVKFDKAAIYQTAPAEGYAAPAPADNAADQAQNAAPAESPAEPFDTAVGAADKAEDKPETEPAAEESAPAEEEAQPKKKSKKK